MELATLSVHVLCVCVYSCSLMRGSYVVKYICAFTSGWYSDRSVRSHHALLYPKKSSSCTQGTRVPLPPPSSGWDMSQLGMWLLRCISRVTPPLLPPPLAPSATACRCRVSASP